MAQGAWPRVGGRGAQGVSACRWAERGWGLVHGTGVAHRRCSCRGVDGRGDEGKGGEGGGIYGLPGLDGGGGRELVSEAPRREH